MDITQYIATHREALLIGDYNAYRAQLSRQLHALWKRLGRATPKKEKFVVKPVTAEDIGKNHAFAHLLLLTSERAWAHAMHIKTSRVDDTSGKSITGSTRSQLISRVHKAAHQAQRLVALLVEQDASKASDTDVLEARAYHATLAGAEEFEKQSSGQRAADSQNSDKRWQKCLQEYSRARVIYAALLEKDKKEVYRDILANTIDVTIRYAAYQARISRTVPLPTVAKRHFPKDDQGLVKAVEKLDPYALKDRPVAKEEAGEETAPLEVPDSVTWRGRKANIVDASIGQALANVFAAEKRLHSYLQSNPTSSTKDKAAAYDEVLIASQDAADATKRATDELEKERVDEGDRRMQDLRVTSLSVSYDLVSWRVGRNRILIGDDDGMTFEPQRQRTAKRLRKDGAEYPEKVEPKGKKLGRLQERAVLYDSIIQSIESVKELRGAMRDANFVEELDGKIRYFRALKCINTAYSHALLDNHLNALALLKRAQDLLSQLPATSSDRSASTHTPPTSDVTPEVLDKLKSHANSLLSRTHAIVEMRTLEQNSAIAAAKHMTSAAPLVQRLNDYPTPGTHVDVKNLVNYPPKIEPVPIKPLFLDVAFNYIQYPGREHQVAEKTKPSVNGETAKAGQAAQPAQKKGWFGFGR